MTTPLTDSRPLIIGAGGGGKSGGGSARVAQEAADSLRSKAYARVVDLVCEGEIEGLVQGLQSVFLDDTPIQNADGSSNFSGVTLESRPGTQQQGYIPGFASVENEVSVGVECKFGQPVVRSITDPDVDAVRLKVSMPALTLQDTTNGDLNGTSVSYAIDVQSAGSGFVQVLADTVSGKTTSRYQRSYYVPLPGTGPWDGGNFVSLPLTSANYVEIRDAQEGDYEFSLRAIGITRKESAPATLSATVLGKTLPPSDVTGFTVQRRMSDLLLSWDELPDADLAGYEVRMGTGWDDAQGVATTSGTQMVHDQDAAGQYPYHIRAYDTSGQYSAHVTTFVLTLLAPATVRQFDVVQSANRLEFRWQPNPEPEVVGYELREGAAWDASLFVAEVKSTSYTLPSGFDGERKFWIKAIASPGIYSDTPTFVSTVVAQPQNANLILERDEQAAGFAGTKHFASVVTVSAALEPVGGLSSLQLY